MVAVIDTGDISEHLVDRALRGKRECYTVAWRQEEWRGSKSHLALLLEDDNSIRWLGRARGRKKVSDRERRVEIVEITEFGRLPLEALRNQLPDRYKDGLRLGVLTDAVGQEVLNALILLYPEEQSLDSKVVPVRRVSPTV